MILTGSYGHVTDDEGRLRNCAGIIGMLDTGGDVVEAIEELYGMIWYLAGGDPVRVAEARSRFRQGLALSPGAERCPDCEGG